MHKAMQESFGSSAHEPLLLPAANASRVYSPQCSISSDPGSWRVPSMSAYPSSTSWTTAEKVDLLVNVLQSVVPDLPSYLMQLVLSQPSEPRWLDMALPKGRSLHSCQIMFEELRKMSPQATGPYRQQTAQYVNIAPAVPAKRSFSEQHEILHPRPLQPRIVARTSGSPGLPVTNGESPIFQRTSLPDTPTELPKKRGRPTKAEAEERDRQLALEGKVHTTKKRPTKKPRPSIDPLAEEVREEESAHPLVDTPTALAPSITGERSIERRRAKSPEGGGPDEDDDGASAEIPEIAVSGAESPSDRLLARGRALSIGRTTQAESERSEQIRLWKDRPA